MTVTLDMLTALGGDPLMAALELTEGNAYRYPTTGVWNSQWLNTHLIKPVISVTIPSNGAIDIPRDANANISLGVGVELDMTITQDL
jgi:hypothetical protein